MKKWLLCKKALLLCLIFLTGEYAYSQKIKTYQESFDNFNTMPAGWTTSNNSGNTSANAFWKIGAFSGSPNYDVQGASDHTGNGGEYAWVDGSFPYPEVVHLETKSFDFSLERNLELRFWHISYNVTYSSSGHNDFSVDFYDGQTWHIGVFTQKGSNASNAWVQKVVDLSAYPPDGNKMCKVRFTVNKNASTTFYNDILIDDFELEGELAAFGMNNAGIPELDPVTVCAGKNNIHAIVQNDGINQVDSVSLAWTLNGVAQPDVKYIGLIDTLLGSSPQSVKVLLDSINILSDSLYSIKAWIKTVNDTVDTVAWNDTIYHEYYAALNGTYTIADSINGDFPDITTAVNLLNRWGVCGPVVFELADSTWNEQVEITDFVGSSPINTVTFTSESGDTSLCEWTYMANNNNSNHIVILNNATNIIFENITMYNSGTGTYGRVVNFVDEPENIEFDNCHIKNDYNSGTSNNAALMYADDESMVDGLWIHDCLLNGGSWALNLDGDRAFIHDNITIEDNGFWNQNYGSIRIDNVVDVDINENEFESASTRTDGRAMRILNTSGEMLIYNNMIATKNDWPRYGIFVSQNVGARSNRNWIANNIISEGDTSSTDMFVGIRLYQSQFTNVVHNTVVVYGKDNNSSALEVDDCSGAEVYNNIFVSMGAGKAVDVMGNGSITIMDYNDLYAPMGLQLASFNNLSQGNLASWTANTGYDQMSVSADPQFHGRLELNLCSPDLDNIGWPSLVVTEDILGAPRDASTPDPGAYEYASVLGFVVDDVAMCIGDTAVFEATVGATDTVVFEPGTPNADTTTTFMTTMAGQYIVEAFGFCGTARDTFEVAINSLAKASNDTNLCYGQMTTVGVDINNGTYMWNTGDTTQNIMVGVTGQYYVHVVDSDGCVSSDTSEIIVGTPVMLGADTAVCDGESVELDPGTGAGSYEWYRDGNLITTASKIFATVDGEYIVNYTDPNSCNSADTLDIVVYPRPHATFTYTQNQNNVEFTADDTTGSNYFWSFGDGKTVNGPAWKTINHYTAGGTNTYGVTLTVTSEFCGDSTYTEDVAVIDVSVVELINNEDINIFPNPNNGLFNIDIENSLDSKLKLQVLDAQGKVIHEQRLQGGSNNAIDLSGTSTGLYLIQIQDAGNTVYQNKISIK
ncbi:T9SS type A sorting domain-containing protein [bacterium SCSIO 12741]|nr:T9SS type A sorting domain-containing protein [bacterium SCSIO 12741]